MRYPKRLMPSTSMLIAFEAAARNGSFVLAASELSLTQGAVGRQAAALERQLDVVFFERVGRSVLLTDAGRAYADDIRPALDTIRDAAVRAIVDPMSGNLSIAILPTFGTRWLMPRLPKFLEANPDITVNFITRLSPLDFDEEEIHSAVQFGDGTWPSANSQFLMTEEVVPVCSPDFKTQHEISEPTDLGCVSLLSLVTRIDAWSKWFELNGLQAPKVQGLLFEQFALVAQAAVAGVGAALLPKFLIDSELQRNELVVLFDQPLESSSAYYVVTPKTHANYKPATAFREWMVATASAGG